MTVRIRVHGTEDACRAAVEHLAEVFEVLSVSGPYPDRGRSVLVRVYLEAELPGDPPRRSRRAAIAGGRDGGRAGEGAGCGDPGGR